MTRTVQPPKKNRTQLHFLTPILFIGLGFCTYAAVGQSAPNPADELHEASRVLQQPESSPPQLSPIERHSDNAAQPDAGSEPTLRQRTPLIREGAFLRNRQGRIVDIKGTWVFIADKDEQGLSDPPLILQPCLRLMEMKRLVKQRAKTLTFRINGTVFAYHGRNYLLPTYYTTVGVAAPVNTSTTPAAPSRTNQADPSVKDLVDEVRSKGSPAAGRAALLAAQRDGDFNIGDNTLLREGTTIESRVGRIHTGRDGQLVFTMDNGPAIEGATDAPLSLSPCLNLTGIELALERYGPQVHLSLSGTIYVYDGANYLIPTVFRIEFDRDGNTVASH